MLVLTRKLGERIKIGEDVWITLLEVGGNRARIGIEAPKEIRILRELAVRQEKSEILEKGD